MNGSYENTRLIIHFTNIFESAVVKVQMQWKLNTSLHVVHHRKYDNYFNFLAQ